MHAIWCESDSTRRRERCERWRRGRASGWRRSALPLQVNRCKTLFDPQRVAVPTDIGELRTALADSWNSAAGSRRRIAEVVQDEKVVPGFASVGSRLCLAGEA